MIRRVVRSAALCAFGLSLFAQPASAATITLAPNSNGTFDIAWSHLVGSTELSALAQFTLAVTDTYVDFLITLTNDTPLYNQRVHSIGFNTAPDGTSLTNQIQGDYFQNFALNTNFPSFQQIDICSWATQNCTGGAQRNNLPGMGTSDTFGFRLNGSFTGGITIERFALQFMGDLGSYQVEGEVPTASVPEPASWLLLTLGLAAAAGVRRRGGWPQA